MFSRSPAGPRGDLRYAALDGASQEVAEELWHCRTTEAAMPILAAHGLTSVYDRIAARASLRSERYIAGEAEVGIVLATMDGELLAMDETARRIGGEEHWHIPCM